MAFRFPLETLLRFRRSVERQQELKLLEAVRQVMTTMQEIEMVDHTISDIQENEHREMGTAVRGAQLHFDVLRCSLLREQRQELEKVLAQREKVRARCQDQFKSAHREREAVEILREDQLHHFQQEETRREQRQMDDLFLLRREYLRR